MADRDLHDAIAVSVADGVATVAIDRPDKKNAISHAMWRALKTAFEALGDDGSVRAIVLTGAGGNFSAGADISEFDAVRGDAEAARAYESSNSEAFAAVRNAQAPTIAAISGVCYGGGFGLAAACDLRFATPDALFAIPAAKLGLAYPEDAMADIVNALGPQLARYMAFSAQAIDAEAALRAGFLLEIIPRDSFDADVKAVARLMADNSPLSIRASKASIAAALARDPALSAKAKALGDATFESADYAEGRAAFKARRKPSFGGR